MEESLTLLNLIKRDFGLGEVDLKTLSPLTLAFVGDCIYDLILRTVIVERHNASPNQLHREKSRLARASAQAERTTSRRTASASSTEKAIESSSAPSESASAAAESPSGVKGSANRSAMRQA